MAPMEVEWDGFFLGFATSIIATCGVCIYIYLSTFNYAAKKPANLTGGISHKNKQTYAHFIEDQLPEDTMSSWAPNSPRMNSVMESEEHNVTMRHLTKSITMLQQFVIHIYTISIYVYNYAYIQI